MSSSVSLFELRVLSRNDDICSTTKADLLLRGRLLVFYQVLPIIRFQSKYLNHKPIYALHHGSKTVVKNTSFKKYCLKAKIYDKYYCMNKKNILHLTISLKRTYIITENRCLFFLKIKR